jgi:hypothetical protein
LAAEALGLSRGSKLLDCEEERHTLTSRELHCHGRIVDSVFLLKLDGAIRRDLKGAFNLIEGVGEAGHELGVLELSWGVLANTLGLHGEGGGLKAELLHVVLAGLEAETINATGNGGALVGCASSLDLHVGLALDLIEGQTLRDTLGVGSLPSNFQLEVN